MEDKQLVAKAFEARRCSYAPYSRFMVGAALLSADGSVFLGCNIENAAYGPTNCAERTAIFKAVSEGQRRFSAIAVCGAPEDTDMSQNQGFAYPCGVCRQVMREFCVPADFRVLVAATEEDYRVFTLAELLPQDFGPEDLG